jgi:hypothetical protein
MIRSKLLRPSTLLSFVEMKPSHQHFPRPTLRTRWRPVLYLHDKLRCRKSSSPSTTRSTVPSTLQSQPDPSYGSRFRSFFLPDDNPPLNAT